MRIQQWAAVPIDYDNSLTDSNITTAHENRAPNTKFLRNHRGPALAGIHENSRRYTENSSAFNWNLYRKDFSSLLKAAQTHEFLLSTLKELQRTPEAKALNVDQKMQNAFLLGVQACQGMYGLLREGGLHSEESLRKEPDRLVRSFCRNCPGEEPVPGLSISMRSLKEPKYELITEEVESLARQTAEEALSRYRDKKEKKRKFEML